MHDQRRRLVGTLRHAPEGAHLHFLDLVSAVDFALQPNFAAHFFRAIGKDGGRHAIRRLVDQVASEVLRLADDERFVGRFFQRSLICIAADDDRDGIDLLIFSVATVIVGIEISYQRTFNDGTHRFFGIHTGGCNDCEAANPTSLQRTHRCTGNAAQIVSAEFLCGTAANQQKTLGLQAGRLVQQVGLKRLACEFAAGQQVGGGGCDCSIPGFHLQLGFCRAGCFCRALRTIARRFLGVVQNHGN